MTTSVVKSPPPLVMIVAALQPNLGIGYQGKMPWRLKQEIKYFRDVTSSTPSPSTVNGVIMGRKTWESIPSKFRPLGNRLNIILSKSYGNTKDETNGVWYYNCFNTLMKDLESQNYTVDYGNDEKRLNRLFVIGGSQIYNSLFNDERVNHLLITDIHLSETYLKNEKLNDSVKIDTFLNWDLKNGGWVKKSHDSLKKFVNDDSVLIPDNKIVEGMFNYEYTYWQRKN